jgi:hypothetical protein
VVSLSAKGGTHARRGIRSGSKLIESLDMAQTPLESSGARSTRSERRPQTSLTRRYRPEPAAKIRWSRYRSRTSGATNTKPHQRPVAQSTTTTAAIQTASSSRITSDDF